MGFTYHQRNEIAMSFLNEKITEEDKRRVDFSRVISPINHKPHSPMQRWTVDRQAGDFLICTRVNAREAPDDYWFTFCWQGRFIEVRLMKALEDVGATSVLTWRGLRTAEKEFLAEVPRDERDACLGSLREALREFCLTGRRIDGLEIRFTF